LWRWPGSWIAQCDWYTANRIDRLDDDVIRPHAPACRSHSRWQDHRADFSADFNTGAYSSWGPTVAGRVPVHASGPYRVPNYRALTRAVHTNIVPSGAFRGFGVPQAAIAQEQLYDDLADKVGMDRLEFRILNAIDDHTPTVTGQVLGEGTGIRACFEALRTPWQTARARSADFNKERRSVCAVESASRACGTAADTSAESIHGRIGLKLTDESHCIKARSTSARIEHHRDPDLRRRARRAHRAVRSSLR
jgi:CO/xanthine dehydrogenase Mo-binding subunit